MMDRLSARPKEQVNLKPELVGKKLICRVWSSDGQDGIPVRVARKVKKYGAKDFTVKIGGVNRTFQINYEDKGIIKQSGKEFLYDTTFDNSVGGLAFHEFPEDVDSAQAYTMFKNSAVDMYVKKGGFPFWYLALAIIGIVILAGGTSYLAIQYSQLNAQHEVDINDLNSASGKIQSLRQQVRNLGGEPIG